MRMAKEWWLYNDRNQVVFQALLEHLIYSYPLWEMRSKSKGQNWNGGQRKWQKERTWKMGDYFEGKIRLRHKGQIVLRWGYCKNCGCL